MKRFIRYLYEYEQAKRIRNVGFVKVEAGNEETIVHMQAKGFHNSSDRKLVLYLFYEDDGKLIILRKCELCLTTPVLSEHLRFSRENDALAENYDRINGVMIETETGRRMVASWDDSCVDVTRVEELDLSLASKESGPKEENYGPVARKIKQKGPVIQEEGIKFTKINRQELAKLPRCEWHLANNKFLIYGYRNYRHLVLVEDDNSWKLGVPGIYHKKEEEAAKTFGFGEFLPIEEADVMLQEEEMHQNEPFGYWCRPVRRR